MAGRVLELRVHGVSNSPVAVTLGLADGAKPRLVAGDATTGFYRPPEDSGGDVALEAYSWGQLTSGARVGNDLRRALWTLLLPFALANVAFHTRPHGSEPDPAGTDDARDNEAPQRPAGPGTPAVGPSAVGPSAERPGRGRRGAARAAVSGWLIRLLCLSLTATLIVAASGVGDDLVGWQCTDKLCLSRIPGKWTFLASGWWHQPGRALLVGMLAPLVLLLVLGVLSWRSYQYEAELPVLPEGALRARPPVGPLQHPSCWSGAGQVRRLALLHLATAAAVAGLVPVGALASVDQAAGWPRGIAWLPIALLAGVVALSVVGLGLPRVVRRDSDPRLGGYPSMVAWLSAIAVVCAVAYLSLPHTVPAPRPPQLPGYERTVAWLGAGQLLLLLTIAAVSRSGLVALIPMAFAAVSLGLGHDAMAQAAGGSHRPRLLGLAAGVVLAAGTLLFPATRRVAALARFDPAERIAWGGRGPALLAGVGWAVGLAYATGIMYWITDRLNGNATPTGRSSIVVPEALLWSSVAVLLSLLVLVIAAGCVGVVFVRDRRRLRDHTIEQAQARTPLDESGEHIELSAHDKGRAGAVAAFRALHRLVGDHAIRIVGVLVAAGAGLALLGAAATLSGARPAPAAPHTGWQVLVKGLVDVGGRLAGLLPLGIAALGFLLYRSDSVRRLVGITWDLATFWPRAAHPLAPPCYAERAVPQLQTRTAGLLHPSAGGEQVDGIILSAHSQGSVIAAAVILQMGSWWRERVWLFSYGCQLTRLYGRIFPACFGPDRLKDLARLQTTSAGNLQWTNFWRNTDPLGWEAGPAVLATNHRQIELTDPEALGPSGGEVLDPPVRNHSGYPDAPRYGEERDSTAEALRR